MRAGLRALLDAEEGFAVVGEAGTGKEAVELTTLLVPDVVLMDVRVPGAGRDRRDSEDLERRASPPGARGDAHVFELDEYVFTLCGPARAGSC